MLVLDHVTIGAIASPTKRPAVTVEPGLFAAGDWIGGEGWLVDAAMASGAAVGLIAAPVDQAGPARRMAVLGAGLELYHAHQVENGMGLVSEPYHEGPAGARMRAARTLTAAGALGALAGRRSRLISALSGVALLAGSALTRFGVFEAGVTSAKDPKYTVVPQRERLDRKLR